MAGHVILLANFYGSYLKQDRFKAVAIVNNAGIEQLATLGLEKVKEVKSRGSPNDEVWVLVVAGLTDVLIKSVEEGKNKLEITPNSTQLLETKMQWAHSLLSKEGAKIIWAVMPPISLRMYHVSEGWNINRIPGMSGGLDKEQRSLNTLMYNYRGLCMRLNSAHAKKVVNGPFFTDMVSDLSHDRGSMNLNTGYFESDGISPTSKLVENWNAQVFKIFIAVEKRAQGVRAQTPPQLLRGVGNGDSWDLPPPKGKSSERLKRSHSDNHNVRGFQGASPMYQTNRADIDRERPAARDRDFERYPHHSRDDRSPMAKIPSLVDMAKSLDNPPRQESTSSVADNSAKEMATAVQLLAATMQLGGGNPNNVQSVLSALVAQQQQQKDKEKRLEEEQILQRRREEERVMLRKQEEARKLQRHVEEVKRQEVRYHEEQRRQELERLEEERRWEEQRRREERLMAERRQIELVRKREEDRLRELNIQKKAAEEQRLREIQIAAKMAMEQQKKKEREEQAKILREQQAQMALMAVTKQVREQFIKNSKPPQTALDRINEKLKIDREQKSSSFSKHDHLSKDPAWASPVVLFSFVNRSNECKPLRGISGPKVAKTSSKASDYKSRGQRVYKTAGSQSPSLSLLKIKVKKPGSLSDFEAKVASFNNRICEMVEECEQLLEEGRFCSYFIRKESEESKAVKDEDTSNANKKIKLEFSASEDDRKPSAKQRLGKPSKDLDKNFGKASQESPKKSNMINERTESQTASRRSIETKPRWDKSDESEDELMWDDDPVPLKVAVDDDDVKSTKGADEANDIEPRKEMPSEAKEDNDAEVIDLNDKKGAEEFEKGVAPEQDPNEIVKVTEEREDFVTLDDTMDGNVKPATVTNADTNTESFVTIDEAT